MIDASGKLLTDIRSDTGVATWLGSDLRVRVIEPKPATTTDKGDVRSVGQYVRFIVISPLSTPRERRLPIQRSSYAVNIFGLTPKDAMAGYVAVSDAIHRAGVRMIGTHPNRLGIWNTFDDTGAVPERDPDTNQPFVTMIMSLIATDQSVAS